MKPLDWILASPLIVVGLYALWAGLLAPAGSCTAQAPGLCFQLGFVVGLWILPLTVICTLVLLVRVALRWLRRT